MGFKVVGMYGKVFAERALYHLLSSSKDVVLPVGQQT